LVSDSFSNYLSHHRITVGVILLAGLGLMAFESELLAWLKKLGPVRDRKARRREQQREALDRIRLDPERALGVVYMSGMISPFIS
jgi:hypothetical protein